MVKIDKKILVVMGIFFVVGLILGGLSFKGTTGYTVQTYKGIAPYGETTTRYSDYECCRIEKNLGTRSEYVWKIANKGQCERMYLGVPFTVDTGYCDRGRCCEIDGKLYWEKDIGRCTLEKTVPSWRCREAFLP